MPWPCAPVKSEEMDSARLREMRPRLLPRVLRSRAGYLMVQPVPSTRRHVERWPRGRRRRFAKPLYGLKAVSRVRIPPSPLDVPPRRTQEIVMRMGWLILAVFLGVVGCGGGRRRRTTYAITNWRRQFLLGSASASSSPKACPGRARWGTPSRTRRSASASTAWKLGPAPRRLQRRGRGCPFIGTVSEMTRSTIVLESDRPNQEQAPTIIVGCANVIDHATLDLRLVACSASRQRNSAVRARTGTPARRATSPQTSTTSSSSATMPWAVASST